MAFHHAEPGDEADEGDIGRDAERAAKAGAVDARMKASEVDASGQGHDPLGGHELRRDVLPADGLRHRDHEARRPAVEPAIEGVRADRLHDVARAHDGARRGGEAIGDGGEPVLLAAVHVHDVGVGQPAEQRPQIARVACRVHAAPERERRDAPDADRARAIDHAGLAARFADEGRRVPGALELGADARGPVRVRRPPPARHEVEHPHGRTRLRLRPHKRPRRARSCR